MTDARHPERWLTDRRFLRLSDAAHRLYGTALLWSVANRTDGVLFDDDLPLLPVADVSRAEELAAAGLWRRDAGMWVVEDYAATQSSRNDLETLEAERRRQRVKMARRRARQPADVPGTRPRELPRDGTGTPVPGTVRTTSPASAPVSGIAADDSGANPGTSPTRPRDPSPGASPGPVPVTPLGQARTSTCSSPNGEEPQREVPTQPEDLFLIGASSKDQPPTGHAQARAREAKPSAAARSTRLPDDWRPGPELAAWARREAIGDDLARSETEKFCDYWHAQPGQRGRKVDWPATWRNWMRKATENARPANNGHVSFRNPTDPAAYHGDL